MDALIRKFKSVGLELQKAKRAFGSNADVFGMDIQRKLKGNNRREFFRIWPGHESNNIQVLGVDKSIKQLVLLVHEKSRSFEQTVSPKEIRMLKRHHGDLWLDVFLERNGLRKKNIKRYDAKKEILIITRETPEEKRHFLLGVDERQLFIAQVPAACATVRDAHAKLKPGVVHLAEGKVRSSRQGEWFFLETTQEERDFCDKMAKKGLVKKKVAIGPGGNPHIADELFRSAGRLLEHGWPIRENDIYVRGAVRHVDHKTIKFNHWRRVIRNTEQTSSGVAGPSGVFWVD